MLLDLVFLVGFVISLVWIGQIALLYSFYRSDRSAKVTRAANAIVENIDNADLEILADRISADNDVCLMLLDENGEARLSIDHVRYCQLHHLSGGELEALARKAPEDGSGLIETSGISPFRNDNYRKESFSGEVPENESRTGQSMMYVRRVSMRNEETGVLMINALVSPAASVIDTMRKQFLYVTFAVLLTTGAYGWMMASGISKPLIETNEAAKKLSGASYSRPPHSGGYREIAELNDTLVQTANDLRKVDDLQRELIANISHDLRTPLTMIQGYAETMRDLPGEMNPENMQVIIDETNRLSSMVTEVLDFSRLRTGILELSMTDFDLTETVSSIRDRVSAMTAREGYIIRHEANESIIVHGDRKRIEQVIYNLLGNALTYTGEDKTVRITQDGKGERVRVSISDSGSGIDPAELPYIWDRYYRTKESHRRAVIGSGLGLSICRDILEKHQVPYGVDSLLGEGTTFWFELPYSS